MSVELLLLVIGDAVEIGSSLSLFLCPEGGANA